MCLLKKLLSLQAILLIATVASAQSKLDSIIQLKEVQVTANAEKLHEIGGTTQHIDSALRKMSPAMSVSDLLSMYSSVNVKSYGPGGLSSASIRGGANSHTSVLWNGMSIQSPMNGDANLSMIPASMMGDISVLYGGNSTLMGSGAVTGAISMQSANLFLERNHTEASFSIKSFNEFQNIDAPTFSVGSKMGNDKIAASVSIFGNKARNNFPYYIIDGGKYRLKEQSHAAMSQMGGICDVQYKVGKNSLLKWSLWDEYLDKEIQTLTSSALPSNETQTDRSTRSVLNWIKTGAKCSWKARAGLLLDKVTYTDPDYYKEPQLHRSYSIIADLENQYIINSTNSLILGLNNINERANSDSYSDIKIRNRNSLFAVYKTEELLKGLTTVISGRFQSIDFKSTPLVYSVGATYNVNSWFKLTGSTSRNYRVATFNDLFWMKSSWAEGNPNLRPESGWSHEGGYKMEYKKNVNISWRQVFFLSDIKDQIVWAQNDKGIWMPMNLNKVNSKGLQQTFGLKFDIKKINIDYEFNYILLDSKQSILVDGIMKDKVMLYTPKYHKVERLTIKYKSVFMLLSSSYDSERYFSQSSEPFEAYSLNNAMLGYNYKFGQQQVTLAFQVRNIFDTKYQLMASYAMPLRNYEVNLKWKINY